MNTDLLFVYGSLLDGNNEFAQYLKHNATYVTTAVFKGRLYDCGDYPGAIADKTGYEIKGSIFHFNDTTSALSVLDDYEGFGPEQEQPNLFIRQMMTTTSDDKPIKCWVYLYNLPVNNLPEITTGDYLAYLNT